MGKIIPAAIFAALLCAPVRAQEKVVMLYPNAAPGSEDWTQKETEYPMGNAGAKGVRNIVKPSLTVYLPEAGKATGAAVIVAPGGAFRFLSWTSEGTMVADWLQQRGVAAFVLKYRVADTGTDEEYAQSKGAARNSTPELQSKIRGMAAADGLQAVKVVREHAAEWHIDPNKIGLMGFSAGGYVVMQAALEHSAESRPNFVASIYGCCINPSQVKIPDDAPPLFILHAYDDPVANNLPALYIAWKNAARPAELHAYAAGGHGFGMIKRDRPTDGWIERFGDWLRFQKLMK